MVQKSYCRSVYHSGDILCFPGVLVHIIKYQIINCSHELEEDFSNSIRNSNLVYSISQPAIFSRFYN